jgi:glycosyltransferase involved in cell wall biosynthesis
MVQIVDGKIVTEDITQKARGGTELMAERMLRDCDPAVLSKFQIIHSRVRDLRFDKKKVLIVHDLPGDPELQHLAGAAQRKRFDKIVFVGNWQAQQFQGYMGIPFSDYTVMYNAIEPIPEVTKIYDGVVKIIYHTTPHRGLEILVPVFEHLAKRYSNIHLDVFSSFNIYGWGDRDASYQRLFDKCKNHPQITYHGSKPNEVIREALRESHIYAYPSIWQECNSLASIEAMSAKNIVVCPNYGGMVDTAQGWANMYQWDENVDVHANRFAAYLERAIQNVMANTDEHQKYLDHQKYFFDNKFNWYKRAKEWDQLLTSLI